MQTCPPGTWIGQYEIASNLMMGGMRVVCFVFDYGNDCHGDALTASVREVNLGIALAQAEK